MKSIKLNNTSHELMPGMVCKVGVHSHETEAGIVLPNHTNTATTRWKEEVCVGG
ncbi:MAG: hypothetical protein R2738_04045 [Bacteroides graminisolvens]